MNIHPKLTLIGAGPGDPELITLKGINALAKAKAILYDALVNPKLLEFSPPGIPKIYVGKRKAAHTFSQEHINKLIVDIALEHGNVVRLKGGDPFVFGRGLEELQYAAGFNIETEYIPGISSSISVPGLQGIPLTHRGISESFWVITGTTSSGELSGDMFKAVQSDATVVILMGISRLAEIVDLYRKNNKSDTPIALIQNGSLPDEKIALGIMSSIESLAEEKQMGSPAIIVIGEVVRLHPQYQTKPLTGNKLFPVFIKLEKFHVLLIGGGPIALEKITAILNNSPSTRMTLVAETILPEIASLCGKFSRISLQQRKFQGKDLEGKDFVISALNDRKLNEKISKMARVRKVLINVADTPELCDFYLSSIVKKGDLKIAISTNGKSPTMAKRIKEVLQESFPEETQAILENLSKIRARLKGDFKEKVKTLNDLTSVLVKDLDH